MQAIVLALVLAAGASDRSQAAEAEQAERAAFEEGVIAELQAKAPAAVPGARRASELYVGQRWEEAIAAYQAVLAEAPGFAHALRRICRSQSALGRRAEAIANCRAALATAPSTENRSALAAALIGDPHEDADLAEAVRLARETLAGTPDRSAAGTACSVALEAQDWDLLSAGVQALRAAAPASIEAHYFASVSALVRGDFALAEAELGAAREAGLDPESADGLATGIRRTREQLEAEAATPALLREGSPVPLLGSIVSVWAGLLGLGVVLSLATSRAAMRLAASPSGTDSAGSRGLRRVYRAVLSLTCLYYFASIPVVLLAVVAAGGGLLLLILEAGRVPVKLVLIIGLMVLVTLWAVLKSVWVAIVRPRDGGDPGARVDPAEQPELIRFVRDVAARVKTRPVDSIFLTPGAEVAVFERGGMMRQLAGRGERCLILGVGVLEGMNQGELAAVLAHEYGHFVNRDTAGGGFALAVRRSILAMGNALAEGGAATWYNPAWWFVRGFYKIFLRVSQGASRLQEILADRWAAILYGGRTFARGLEHAIAQSVRFDHHAQRTVNLAIESGLGLRNLYQHGPAADDDEVETAIRAALDAEPSPYDSHPRPRDRMRWTEAIRGEPRSTIDDGAPAWALFSDREALERAMTLEIKLAVAANHGIEIPDEAPPAAAQG